MFNIQKVQHDLMLNIDMLPVLKNGKYPHSTAVEVVVILTIFCLMHISTRIFDAIDPALNRYLDMGITSK